ncbi:hypothetical protein [Burkholderia ubonensis]|uniref:hypothetical protein n=1 Tax=Burkholderia ubonensis TaxID=101571 RepID=UPI000AC19405|nr:hypothetical protein [Burkholderia ubonensis]
MAYTVFWAIPSTYLKGPAAAGGIALINTIGVNTIGVLGGFLSPAASAGCGRGPGASARACC